VPFKSKSSSGKEDVPKVQTADVPKVQTEDVPKVKTEDVPKAKTEDVPKVHTEDVPKVQTEDVPKVKTEDVPKVHTEDVPKVQTEDVPNVKTVREVLAAILIAEVFASSPTKVARNRCEIIPGTPKSSLNSAIRAVCISSGSSRSK
jgi:hypothetical protein